MEDEILGWAEVVCSRPPKSAGPDSPGENRNVKNTYSIAVDLEEIHGDNFTCPCCGEDLAYQIVKAGRMSNTEKRKVVREKQAESMKYLKAFAWVSAFTAAASIVYFFLKGALAVGVGGIAGLLFVFVWFPGLVLMIKTLAQLRSRDEIVKQYEKRNPIKTILRNLRPDAASKHYFTEFPPLMTDDDPDSNYGLE